MTQIMPLYTLAVSTHIVSGEKRINKGQRVMKSSEKYMKEILKRIERVVKW